jgi:hypothetical protein
MLGSLAVAQVTGTIWTGGCGWNPKYWDDWETIAGVHVELAVDVFDKENEDGVDWGRLMLVETMPVVMSGKLGTAEGLSTGWHAGRLFFNTSMARWSAKSVVAI